MLADSYSLSHHRGMSDVKLHVKLSKDKKAELCGDGAWILGALYTTGDLYVDRKHDQYINIYFVCHKYYVASFTNRKYGCFRGLRYTMSVTSYILMEPELPTKPIYFKCGCPLTQVKLTAIHR